MKMACPGCLGQCLLKRGYRLEVLITSSSGLLFADASVWDQASSLDRRIFEREFWPIINTLVDRGLPLGGSG